MIAIITPIISNLFLVLWILGLSFLWLSTRKNLQSRQAGIIFLMVLWLLGTRPVADLFLYPLENQYKTPEIKTLKELGVNQVVVLTGGGFPVRGELLSSAFTPASLSRFISGLELDCRLGAQSVIIFSGTAGRHARDRLTSEVMERLARLLIPAIQAISEKQSSSTEEHPGAIKPYVQGPFALVTSAYHMPRSMRTFNRGGLTPIPYPVNFMVSGDYHWGDWIPSFENFRILNIGFREYLALALYWLKGWQQ
jgi:uncharacterized SAM-binding protein YcdF (DUF218 family)